MPHGNLGEETVLLHHSQAMAGLEQHEGEHTQALSLHIGQLVPANDPSYFKKNSQLGSKG